MNEVGKTSEIRTTKRCVDYLHRYLERLAVRFRFFTTIYIAMNRKMTLDEFAMVDLPKGCSVLDIGCGSLPWTLLILAQNKKWRFVGIDRDHKAVVSANKIMSSFNLSDRVEIREADGLDVDTTGFDLVIVAFGVNPRIKLLEKIGKNLKQKGVVVFRTTWERLDTVYGHAGIPPNLKIQHVFYRKDGIKSFLLGKSEKNK